MRRKPTHSRDVEKGNPHRVLIRKWGRRWGQHQLPRYWSRSPREAALRNSHLFNESVYKCWSISDSAVFANKYLEGVFKFEVLPSDRYWGKLSRFIWYIWSCCIPRYWHWKSWCTWGVEYHTETFIGARFIIAKYWKLLEWPSKKLYIHKNN